LAQGDISTGRRRYIGGETFLIAASQQVIFDHRYIALFAWTLIIWVSWNPLIDNRLKTGTGAKSVTAISLIGKLLFGIYLCSAVLLFEKFSIQWIAGKFHERSYAGLYNLPSFDGSDLTCPFV
jgi:hypothetical protein